MTADIRMALENELDQLDESQIEGWLERCFDACDPRYDSDWLNGMMELALMTFPENYEVRAAASRAATMEAQRLYDDGDRQEAIGRLERLLENDPYCTDAFELLEKFMQGAMGVTDEIDMTAPPPVTPEPVAAEPPAAAAEPVTPEAAGAPVTETSEPARALESEIQTAPLDAVVGGDDDLLSFLDEDVLGDLDPAPAGAPEDPRPGVSADAAELPDSTLALPMLEVDGFDVALPDASPQPAPELVAAGVSAPSSSSGAQAAASTVSLPTGDASAAPLTAEPVAAPAPTVAPAPVPTPEPIPQPAAAPTPAPTAAPAPPPTAAPTAAPLTATAAPTAVPAAPARTTSAAIPAAANGGFDWRSVVALPGHGQSKLEPQLEALLPSLTERFTQAGNYRSLVLLLTDLYQRDSSHMGVRTTLNNVLRDWAAQLEQQNRGPEAGQVAAWSSQLLGAGATWTQPLTQRYPAQVPSLPDLAQYGGGSAPAWMGWVNLLRDNPERAEEAAQALNNDAQGLQSLFRHLAVHHPNHPEHVLNLGWAYSRTGQHALAMVHTQRSLQLKPNPRAYQLLQKIYTDLGQPDMAQRAAQQMGQLKA
jgi:tetratricopeptide (TPR) repeat protein